ncbi:DUF421 domain-containing protein [Anaerosporobacter sp.]|uniref:DUF421 domain-containing protein n=1 Tax=Anaerosporobacter sp. TaxID=1872529 RepID=UPI00286F6CF1|nr:DUF421 domain-containing protein [Anaerosporobacter sp.]
MEIIQVILTSLGSIVTLFILSKLMGIREMSQLTMFDYINGITIGSIAAEMATTEFTDAAKPFTAMIVYALIVILISELTSKSIKFRRIATGKPAVLYDNGVIYEKSLRKAKLDLGEFLCQCRVAGYFDLSTIQTIILEPNGKLSILPLADERPITGKDMNLTLNQDYLVANVIIDGHIMTDNLKHTGKNESWLHTQLKAHQVNEPSEVFLATCDRENTLHVYKKDSTSQAYDILE